MKKEKYAAVVLAAGQGKRMGSSVHKQYLLLRGKPVLYYALDAFEKSPVDEIVLVVGAGEIHYCQKEIVERYGFQKVKHIVEGGAQRYHSVFCGLKAVEKADYVLIHDGARPFVDQDIIKRCMESAKSHRACVAGMPVKDTIKLADEKEFAQVTPNRERVWMIQTPQAFSYSLIYQAYETLLEAESGNNHPACEKEMLNPDKVERLMREWEQIKVTDDAMVVELLTDILVKLVRGSYENIKITTPEDLSIAEGFCEKMKKAEKNIK